MPPPPEKSPFCCLKGESFKKNAPLAVPATYTKKKTDLKAFLCLKEKKRPVRLHELFPSLSDLAHAHPYDHIVYRITTFPMHFLIQCI